MISTQELDTQLKRIGFKKHGWGRGEILELPNILLPEEEIFECVNGIYEGGFALLVATDVRVLLVDKKPLNYLTVEDLRFDMINELDYSHRLLGANISISAGNKNLKFRSYNQPRLRKLITHVQHCMAEVKKKQTTHQEGQNQHLEQINQQLQAYLVAQYEQQQKMHEQLETARTNPEIAAALPPPPPPEMPKGELADYLFAQSLLSKHQQETGQAIHPAPAPKPPTTAWTTPAPNQTADLYKDGINEVFGKHAPATQVQTQPQPQLNQVAVSPKPFDKSFEINPLKIAYSKLPVALRNRRFGRPSFHAHSQNRAKQPEPLV